MPYCQNCGRPLSENEVCGCTPQNPAPNSGMPNPAVYNYQNVQNQQAFAQNQNPNAPKKNNTAVIIIIVIAVLMMFVLPVIGILAAILVPSMLGYVAKSQQTSINSVAKTLCNTYDIVLVEMDSQGYVFGEEPCIICSDSYLNIDVPFDDDMIYANAEKFFTDIDNYTYFVVVENGRVAYVACEETDGGCVGTFPATTSVNEGPKTFFGYIGNDDWNVDDLYYCTYNDLFGDSCSSGH